MGVAVYVSMQRFRYIAVRILVVIGILTTIATSAPPDFDLFADADDLLANNQVGHVSLLANASAADHADHFVVTMDFHYVDGPDPIQVRVIPDDPALDMETLEIRPGQQGSFQQSELGELCAAGADCEIGFSYELVDGLGAVEIFIAAQLIANGDPSFLFPEDRDFPSDATLDVRIDE